MITSFQYAGFKAKKIIILHSNLTAIYFLLQMHMQNHKDGGNKENIKDANGQKPIKIINA